MDLPGAARVSRVAKQPCCRASDELAPVAHSVIRVRERPSASCAIDRRDSTTRVGVVRDFERAHVGLGVNSLHYRGAALLSASPQLAVSIRAAKGFRVVPTAVNER